MPYSILLNKIVAESKYTVKEIIEKCEEQGVHIDKTYFSKIQNGKVGAPKEEISRTIAKVCKVDERKLVLESYLDKAPNEVKDFLIAVKNVFVSSSLQMLNSAYDEKIVNKLQEYFANQPLSDYIVDYLDNISSFENINQSMFNTEIKQNDVTIRLSEPIGIEILDNAMIPLIPNKSKVCLKLQETYNNGDIIAVKEKSNNKNDLIIRYALFNENTVLLTALNKEYKQLVYNKEDIVIMGKVIKVITDIEY